MTAPPKRAVGIASEHVANAYMIEVFEEKDPADIDNEAMIQTLLFDPHDEDIRDSQIEALFIARGEPIQTIWR